MESCPATGYTLLGNLGCFHDVVILSDRDGKADLWIRVWVMLGVFDRSLGEVFEVLDQPAVVLGAVSGGLERGEHFQYGSRQRQRRADGIRGIECIDEILDVQLDRNPV